MQNHDWNYVIRRVRNKPVFLKDNGTVSSALFKDSKGVSVDKDHLRREEEIILDEERLHNLYIPEDNENNEWILKFLVGVNRTICLEQEIFVNDCPLEENIHHCLLQKSEQEIKLSKPQARALARNAWVLKQY